MVVGAVRSCKDSKSALDIRESEIKSITVERPGLLKIRHLKDHMFDVLWARLDAPPAMLVDSIVIARGVHGVECCMNWLRMKQTQSDGQPIIGQKVHTPIRITSQQAILGKILR